MRQNASIKITKLIYNEKESAAEYANAVPVVMYLARVNRKKHCSLISSLQETRY